MKKKKSVSFLICFLLVSLLFTLIPQKVLAKDEEIEIKATFGIDGVYKLTSSVPMEVEIKNTLKEELNGDLEVIVPNNKGTNDSYIIKISLKSEETKKVFVPLNNVSEKSKVEVRALVNGSILGKKEVVMSATPAFNQGLIGTFSDDIKSLEYLNDFNTKDFKDIRLESSKVIGLTNDILLSNYKNIQMLDIILINNYDSSKFTKEALNNLDMWIKNGGILLIGGGTSTLNNMDKSFLNVDYSNPYNKWIQFKDSGVSLNTGDLSGDIGNVTVGDSNKIISTTQKRGNGSIIITSFDLGSKAFYEYEDVNAVLVNMMKDDLLRKFNDYSYMNEYPQSLDNALSNIPLDESLSVKSITITLVIFILLVSFIGYVILKKLNKRGLIWIAIPLTSLVFTFIIYNIGLKTSVGDKILNCINMVSVDKEGNGKIESYIAIGNKYNSALSIEEPEGIKVEHIMSQFDTFFSLPSSSSKEVSLKTIYDGNKTFYNFDKVGSLESKKFKIMGKEEKVNKYETSLNFLESGLSGKINNPYDVDIKQMFVVFGNNVWEIGELKARGEYTFNNSSPTSSSGISGFRDSIMRGYFEKRSSNDRSEDKYKDIQRTLGMLEFASVKGSSTPYCIAITDKSMEYGLTFEKEEVSKYSKTCYISDIEIGMTDGDGNTVYPIGYFTSTTESSSDGLYVNDRDGLAWGKGEAVLSYHFPEKFVPSLIKLKSIENNSNMGPNGEKVEFTGSIQIYNFKTGKFENVAYKNDTGADLTDIKDYVNEDNLKLKFICKDEQGSSIPLLGAKGRFKQ